MRELSKKPLIRRQLNPTAGIPPEADHAPRNTLDFRSSDETIDRYCELISVSGWRLENYRKNPVVQNAHSCGSVSDTIGKAIITEVRGDHLFQRISFAVEENPMAKVAYQLYRGGFLNAVSVGFIPLRWENGNKDLGYRRKYLEQDLIEVSAVSIPANPNAISMALEAGALEQSDLRELFQLLKHFCTEKADRIPDTSALGSAIHEARFLQLNKQLNQIRALLRRN